MTMRSVVTAFLLLVAIGAIVLIALFVWIDSRGVSAKAAPGRLETAVARTMRHLAIPRAARNRSNPIGRTPEVIAEGMAHYADHCAACHANDGSGDTEIGLGLYPKPPDMRRAATQSLTDGELFFIIENGVRLTGMPAWSTGHADSEKATWHLVHFIRHLPMITPDEIEQMEALNPTSPEEIRQDIEAERFLQGDDSAPPAQPEQRDAHEHK